MSDQRRSDARTAESPLQVRDDGRGSHHPGSGTADPSLRTERTEEGASDSPAADTAPLGAVQSGPDGPDAVVRAVMEPTNRAKLLLATAVLTVLNMLLLLLLLAVTWTGPEQIMVDGERCIISEVDGENALFCES